jgi:hypothetical protein
VTRAFRIIGIVVLAGTCIAIVQGGAGVITAQGPRTADSSDAAVSALVAEVRALRTQLVENSQRGLRLQLLMGRIQMQEQRIAYLDRQRSEITTKLSDHVANVARMRGQAEMISGGGACNLVPDRERRDCEFNVRVVKQELATQEAAEQRMRAQESDLLNAVSEERGRWSDFNARLDELERELASR